MSLLTTAIIALCVAAALTMAFHRMAVHRAAKWLKVRRRSQGSLHNQLYERLYGMNWKDVATNNYGFAPAEDHGPERFQLQMYKERLDLFRVSGRLKAHTDLLEVSCGRGGGLVHLLKSWPGTLRAIGLDYSANALRFCGDAYRDLGGLTFARGSALQLPFANGSFDVVVNVEASNDYGDFGTFFREVRRVLCPGGAFLHCDSRRPRQMAGIEQALRDAGFEGEFRDITGNITEACRLDSDRRRLLLHTRVPWYYRMLLGKKLASYAAIEGSGKFESFRSSRRLYLMTCAIRGDTALGKTVGTGGNRAAALA